MSEREGPEVSLDLECRGCIHLRIWAGMCDTHYDCEKCGGGSLQGHGRGLTPPKKCPFRKNAIKKFTQTLKESD